jgi:hypothetical protein
MKAYSPTRLSPRASRDEQERLERLPTAEPTQPPGTAFDLDLEKLRLQSFFPGGISQAGLNLLSGLRAQQLRLREAGSRPREDLGPQSRIRLSRHAVHGRAHFERTKNEIREELLPTLTAVQRDILERVYFQV